MTEILGAQFGATRPAGGFFLWLDVGDGEAAARRLWAEGGVRVLPGAYMGRPDENGVNPGQRYIRVALVYDTETTAAGLRRMRQVLSAVPARRLGGGQESKSQAAASA